MRDVDDDLIESWRRTIAIVHAEVKEIRFILALRRAAEEAKFNPHWETQPRAPGGGSDGGQWVGGGGGGARLIPTQGRTGMPTQENFPAGAIVVARGDNPIRIARRRLGPHATNAEILAYAHELIAI